MKKSNFVLVANGGFWLLFCRPLLTTFDIASELTGGVSFSRSS